MKKTTSKLPVLLVSLLLPMALMAAVLALCGIAPFGSRSFGVLDMSSQYLSFLGFLRQLISGQASLFYLPGLSLGGNLTGVTAYYLMSPLNLLCCLFSRENLLTAVSLLYILRVGLASMTMAVYAGERHGWGWRVLGPGLAYGFMAFLVCYSICYQWQDCVILLPVIALGVARLTEGRGWRLYALSLGAALILNFYVGYILCLGAVLFFLFSLLTGPAGRRVRRALTFALASLLAGALAAVVLVPAAAVLMGGKASFSPSDLHLTGKFPPASLFAKLLVGSFRYDELTPAGLPNIFCGTVTAALAALYFADGRVPRRRRLAAAGLLGALALSFWVSALDLIWHGFNVPEWYNYRYSFLFSFVVIAAADKTLSLGTGDYRPRQLIWPLAASAAVAALALLGPGRELVRWQAGLWAVAVTAALCGGLYALGRPGAGKRLAAGLGAGLLVLHMADLGANAKLSLSSLTATSSDPAKWAQYTAEKAAAIDLIDTKDAFVRVESPELFDQNRDESMLFGYDGLSHYGSTLPLRNLEFLSRLGVPFYREIFTLYGSGVTAGVDSLLGVKYLAASDTQKPYERIADTGSFRVYENPYALPVGWTADQGFAQDIGAEDPFSYTQALYAAAAPEAEADIYTFAQADEPVAEGLTDNGGGRYTLPADARSGNLIYTVNVRADGPLYGVVDIADWPGVMVFVDGAYTAYYATGQSNGPLYLGEHAAGDRVEVRIQAATDLTVNGAAFATEHADALAVYRDAMADGACPLTRLSDDHFTGSFSTGRGDELLVLTIPADPGWRILLDGEEADVSVVQGCLTALDVTPGSHTLDMRYTPPGLLAGGLLSAAALALLAALSVPGLRSRRQK